MVIIYEKIFYVEFKYKTIYHKGHVMFPQIVKM